MKLISSHNCNTEDTMKLNHSRQELKFIKSGSDPSATILLRSSCIANMSDILQV